MKDSDLNKIYHPQRENFNRLPKLNFNKKIYHPSFDGFGKCRDHVRVDFCFVGRAVFLFALVILWIK